MCSLWPRQRRARPMPRHHGSHWSFCGVSSRLRSRHMVGRGKGCPLPDGFEQRSSAAGLAVNKRPLRRYEHIDLYDLRRFYYRLSPIYSVPHDGLGTAGLGWSVAGVSLDLQPRAAGSGTNWRRRADRSGIGSSGGRRPWRDRHYHRGRDEPVSHCGRPMRKAATSSLDSRPARISFDWSSVASVR